VKKAKIISKTPKSKSQRIQKESKRIQKTINKIGIAKSLSINYTPNIFQKINKL